MSDSMTFPDTVEEFMEQYKVVDTDGIYMSKGSELVPIFRMMQWFEQLPSAQPDIIRCKDCKYYSHPWHCEAWNNSPGFPAVSDEMFCSMAERRTDE